MHLHISFTLKYLYPTTLWNTSVPNLIILRRDNNLLKILCVRPVMVAEGHNEFKIIAELLKRMRCLSIRKANRPLEDVVLGQFMKDRLMSISVKKKWRTLTDETWLALQKILQFRIDNEENLSILEIFWPHECPVTQVRDFVGNLS